ncbi:MAG TPA: ComF family protein [Halothiobacillaceae bacterium]|nr:ComF family protein [Halothiobacillaceae bacterium]
MVVDQAGLCHRCHQKGRLFDQVITACAWDEQTRHIVHRLKYHHDFSVLRLIVESMITRLESGSPPAFEQLIAMPQHPQRRIERGFDQARLIAQQLGKRLALPVSASIIKRVTHTPSLTGLNRQQRQAILTNAFALTISAKQQIARHVALVDDVLTTGASARAAARQLYQAGAERVSVLVFARVQD